MDPRQIFDAAVAAVLAVRPKKPRLKHVLNYATAVNIRKLAADAELTEKQRVAVDAWAADVEAAADAATTTLIPLLPGWTVYDVRKLVGCAVAWRYAKLQAWSPEATADPMSSYALFVFGRKCFGKYISCNRHVPMRTEAGVLSALFDLVLLGDLDLELRVLLLREIKPRIDAARSEIQSFLDGRVERARAVAETNRAREIIDGVPRRGPGRPRKQTNQTNQTELEMP